MSQALRAGAARTDWIAVWLLCPVTVLAIGAEAQSREGAGTLLPKQERLKELAAMLPETPKGVGRPITDREAWKELSKSRHLRDAAARAAAEMKRPMPTVTDEDYLSYAKTGRRTGYQRALGAVLGRYRLLAYAECIENRKRFVAGIEEAVGAICALKTWVPPYHDYDQMNFRGRKCSVDLTASAIAGSLATGDYWLGDRLSKPTRELLRRELKRRIFDPVRRTVRGTDDHRLWWLKTTNNWNAVCNAGVTVAAMSVIESPKERAFFLGAAELSLRRYLQGFTDDGYCSEGLGYWNYGFSHYVLLADAAARATGGKLDLLKGGKLENVSLFGARMEILPGVYPAIADASISTKPGSQLMGHISRRMGLGWKRWERCIGPASAGLSNLMWTGSFAFPYVLEMPAPAVREGIELNGPREWYPDAQFLICRPGPEGSAKIGVAIKGGHNAEHHNHNDVGTYLVAVGRETPLLDPGTVVYTSKTFSRQRYTIRVINSFGHPVPMVAGKLQKTGRQARARILKSDFSKDRDVVTMDIRAAYDAPGLTALSRSFIYDRRGAGSLTVIDEVAFGKPSTFGAALITCGDWSRQTDGSVIVTDRKQAVRVVIDAGGKEIEIRPERIDEEVRSRRKPLRLGIDLKRPTRSAKITMHITPVVAGR